MPFDGSDGRYRETKLWGSWRLNIVILGLLANVLNVWSRFTLSIIVVCMTGTKDGTLEGDFDWDKDIIAWILSGYFYGYVSTQLLAGFIVEKYGGKWPLLCSVFASSILIMFMPVLAYWHWSALMVARVIQGALGGFDQPALYQLATVWSPKREKATLFALCFSGIIIASVINYPLSALMCYSDPGWSLVFYVQSSLGIVWCITFFILGSNSPLSHPYISEEEKQYFENEGYDLLTMESETTPHFPVMDAVKSMPLHALWIAHFGANYGYYVMTLNFPLYVNEIYEYGIVVNGLICAIPYSIGCFTIIVGKFYDWIVEKKSLSLNTVRKTFNTTTFLGAAFFLCMVQFFPEGVGYLASLTVASFLIETSFNAGFFISHSDLAGPYTTIVFGLTNTMANLTGIIGPLIMASLVSDDSTEEEWQNVFYVAAAILTFSGVIYLVFGSSNRQVWAGGEEKRERFLCLYH